MYVYLEGTWHPMGENEHTVCGIVVPHGTDWVRAVPEGDDVHYGDDATPTDVSRITVNVAPSKPKAKAKKG